MGKPFVECYHQVKHRSFIIHAFISKDTGALVGSAETGSTADWGTRVIVTTGSTSNRTIVGPGRSYPAFYPWDRRVRLMDNRSLVSRLAGRIYRGYVHKRKSLQSKVLLRAI
jgi:hypothetical protein